MKTLRRFKHLNANTIDSAVSILRQYGDKACIMAGGTDLIGIMRFGVLPDYPEVVINLKTIPGLDYIKEENGVLKVGAMTRLEDIAANSTIKNKYTALAEAASKTASPHVRAMGTIGGNICQLNRCWYFRKEDNRFNCIRKGGKMCPALLGDNRYHSIFGAVKVATTPCSKSCPAGIEIPLYLGKIRNGNLLEAANILLYNNPLPSITGRVCPHFCEQDCNRGEFDETISIRSIERYLGDYILENTDKIFNSKQNENGKSVAIVGSGPAGLSAAYYLRKMGYSVSIFEANAEPGGILTYGIPQYRLPKELVKKQIEALKKTGIQVKTNTRVGQEVKISELAESFNAIFLACGAWKEKHAEIKGKEFILSGIEFLRNSNSGLRKVPGKKVAVMGGGNVAIDVARMLKRLGAEPVIIYRRSYSEMPALREEVIKALEEDIKTQFLTLPVEVLKRDSIIVLKCIKMELGPVDQTGRPQPVPIDGSDFTMDFDAVLEAYGEEPDYSTIPRECLNEKGKLKINIATHLLSGNIFAGGDFVNGPSTVIQAISDGREAAKSIGKYLDGEQQINDISSQGRELPESFIFPFLEKTKRNNAPELPVDIRIHNLEVEEVGGLDANAFKEEAHRCFNCGCFAVNPSDIAPALIALAAKIKTTKRVIEAEKFFTVDCLNTTILDSDEIVLEIEIPALASNIRCKFIKFALRKSIDFPIVSCAAAVESEKGVVKSAKICLNAVYNIPYRAVRAEDSIKGNPIDEANAEAAGVAGISEAIALPYNKYKIQIAKALIKRAILACK